MTVQLSQMANALRILSVDMIEKAKSGHPGMPLGMADIATVLWTRFLHFDASEPNWINRDRFILSNGHGSALLYSLLYLTGFKDVTLDEVKNFRQLGSKTAGHPEKKLLSGVDFSTGPLGQGLAGAVGMALAERILNAKYKDELINHKTYVVVGDGCLMEGVSEEAISLAGHLELKNLIVLWDDNGITIDGSTKITTSTNMKKRFIANGWMVFSCDGHNFKAIERVLKKAQNASKPVLIDCKTTIGYGAPIKAGTSASHGSPLGSDEVKGLRKKLNWQADSFEIPFDILKAWRVVGNKWKRMRLQWEKTVQDSPKRREFIAQFNKEFSPTLSKQMADYKAQLIKEKKTISTRKASQGILEILTKTCDFLIGGSADLAGASFTKTSHAVTISKENYSGNYINYGIREHGMGGVMNGLAAYGGLLPFSSTFLSFVDYMKPAIRLACLMEEQEIYVLTHDSIGVGEDGPTHQPIEQLISLRSTPNLNVFRPADSVEVAECYEIALQTSKTPSVMILSRQELPVLRTVSESNLSSQGAYVLIEAKKERQITLIATGSEVSLAVDAQKQLAKKNISTAVVSMPCWELFEKQTLEYQQKVLGKAPRLVIEAGSSFGWDRFIGEVGAILAIDHFGISAPGKQIFKEFGFTTENIENIALNLISLKGKKKKQ